MSRRRFGYVSVPVQDILDEVEDDDLLAEVADRGISQDLADGKEMVVEAYNELRRGRPLEALAILDRLLNPKWSSSDKCKTAYADFFKPIQAPSALNTQQR